MYQKVKAYVKKHHMLEEKNKVVVGVSGGADSICLLFVLLEMKKELDLSILAVHVHHGIRGESADADEKFVRRICQENQIDLLVFKENVKTYAKENSMTEEEAGRVVRRNIFQKVLKERGADKIALAHHENDNAETVLWNLCRGAGLNGMGGIRPVNGAFIRPLLCVKRTEIESYLEKKAISYCVDETNLSNQYTRNRIRNQLIPYLEKNINEKSLQHIAETAVQLAELSDFIQAETRKYLQKCAVFDEDGLGKLHAEMFGEIPEALKGNVLHHFICEVCRNKKNIEAVHVEMLKELLEKQVGRKCDLPYDMEAVRTYEGINIRKKGISPVKTESLQVKMKEFLREDCKNTFPEKNYTKWFDCDIIKNTVEIRHRKPGDYIVIDKIGNTQKLKQYFINEKIPQEERDKIWLAADGQEIMWIIGYRQSQAYQITDKTIKILEIDVCGGGQ